MMKWSNKIIMEFLNLYEGEPGIWDPQNDDHKDRHKIYDAWKRIQDNFSVECSLNELKKKKEILMATYRKLALKVKKSRKSGSGTNEPYKPEWFAYEKMASFLDSIYTPRKTTTSVSSDEGPDNEQDDPLTNDHAIPVPVEFPKINTTSSSCVVTCYDEDIHDTAATTEAATIIVQGRPLSSRKRKAQQTATIEKRKGEAYNLCKQVVNKPNAASKEESSLFCELLCLKLNALDDDTREVAMHEINNLMFNLKKNKTRHPYWSYNHDYQQPGYSAKSVPRGRSANLVKSPVDGSEMSFSSCASSEHNPPATKASPQCVSNDNQIEMSCNNAAEFLHTFDDN